MLMFKPRRSNRDDFSANHPILSWNNTQRAREFHNTYHFLSLATGGWVMMSVYHYMGILYNSSVFDGRYMSINQSIIQPTNQPTN